MASKILGVYLKWSVNLLIMEWKKQLVVAPMPTRFITFVCIIAFSFPLFSIFPTFYPVMTVSTQLHKLRFVCVCVYPITHKFTYFLMVHIWMFIDINAHWLSCLKKSLFTIQLAFDTDIKILLQQWFNSKSSQTYLWDINL